MTATRFLVTMLASFVTLLVLWCAAGTASAATYQETCKRIPLTQAARVGETVQVCELRRVASVVSPTRTVLASHHTTRRATRVAATRVGHTTVVARLGVRGVLRVATR